MARIGAGKLALMGAVATALLVGLAYLQFGAGSGPMAYLFTDLEPAAAQSIADKLQAEAVPFQISPDGTAIMAPQSRLADLRMSLAGDRLSGKVGYEILDNEQPFGVSASRARIDETRAIEGELARSIRTLDHVQGARVHIVMPDKSLFATGKTRSTAAVTVKTASRLSGENVQAIRYLVASAVADLSPDSVSVIDQTGALLARSGDPDAISAGDADERQQAIEAKLRQQVEGLLEPIVGVGKVRAEVAAVIDRDQTREESTSVDPDKQAISHQVTVENNDQNSGGSSASGGPASVSSQLPETPKTGTSAQGASGSSSKRAETSEDTTYDNSKSSTVTVHGPGRLKRLTVAVMVDSGSQPLPPPMIAKLQKLVENAVGFDASRGDSVAVESMKFSAAEVPDAGESFLSKLPTDQLFSLLKLLIIAAVGLFALRFFRSTLASLTPTDGPALPGPAGQPLIAQGAAGAALAPPADADPLRAAVANAENRGNLLDQEIALAEVDGRIKLSALKRIGDTVQGSPAEATAVIRQWMSN